MNHNEGRWLVTPSPLANAELKLFCCSYAGGNASIFRHWSQRLTDGVELSAIQLPGRAGNGNRQPLTNMSPLVGELGPIVLASIDRPFAFFGHSLGAVIAFELTRWLRSRGYHPEILVVAGRRAPQIASNSEPLYRLADADLIESLRTLSGTPQEVLSSPELMRLVLPWVRADFELAETYSYVHDAPLSCPILALGGTGDTETADGRLAAWKDQTTATFNTAWFDAGHFFVQHQEDKVFPVIISALSDRNSKFRTASS